jgi:zinc transport system substrate-binding protein
MNKKIFSFVIVGSVVIFLIGFFVFQKKITPATMNNKIKVATSFYPIYFLTSQIGGDFVEVNNLTPAGTEPHDYDLTAKDIIKIKKSEVLILNGGGLEVWEDEIKKSLAQDKVRLVVLRDELLKDEVANNKNNPRINNDDPHIWLSPMLAIEMAEKITSELIKIDLTNKNYYQSNLNVLKTKLLNLDSDFRQGLEKCKKRDFVTAHRAFGYLAKEYSLNQIAIAGISPEEEPAPRQLAEISQFARENEIKYIFFESLVSPKLSQVIADEIGAGTLVLNPIEGLNDEEIGQGKNYITEMEANLENLKVALECDSQ